METLTRSAIHTRCLLHTHRARILGIRTLTTTTTHTPKPTTPPTTPNTTTTTTTTTTSTSTSPKTNNVKAKTEIPLLTLQPQTLHTYTTTPPPTAAQLHHSTSYFSSPPPTHLWTSAYFRQFPSSTHPEVAFLGRSNVGKSSLLNALFNRPKARTAHVSKKPGRTRTMNAFGVGPERVEIAEGTESWKMLGRGGCVVVDMPGYGKGSRDVWGVEIMKYLERRKQLRKTFLLLDIEHGPKSTDLQLLAHLRNAGIQHQIILSKADKFLFPGPRVPSPQRIHNGLVKIRNVVDELKEKIQQPGADVLVVSAEKDLAMVGMPRSGRLGVDAVRWAVLRACGLDCDEHGRTRQMERFDVEDIMEGGA